MAGSVNKVILVGNLGGDPEVRYTPGGQAVANFNIATSESWNNKQGNREERTEWHRIVAWGRLAELCGEYLAKGRKVYIEGRLQTRSYDKDGVTRYVTEIKAQDVQFLDGTGGPSLGEQAAEGGEMGEPRPQARSAPAASGGGAPRAASGPAGGGRPAAAPAPSRGGPPPRGGAPQGGPAGGRGRAPEPPPGFDDYTPAEDDDIPF